MPGLLDLPALAQFLGPGGSGDAGGSSLSPGVYVTILLVGFAIATVGHIVRARTLVALGIALVFGVTVLAPTLLLLTN